MQIQTDIGAVGTAKISCHVKLFSMRVLGNPLAGDDAIVSGESGASTMGLVSELLMKKQWKNLKERIGLDEQSKILCFSTEGDTDQKNYRRIVWNGAYPNI